MKIGESLGEFFFDEVEPFFIVGYLKQFWSLSIKFEIIKNINSKIESNSMDKKDY